MKGFSFDASTHTYRVGGNVLPSVTEVMRPLDSFTHVPADALEYARERGTYVHQAMALMARNDLDWLSVEPTWLPYVRAGERFLLDSEITVTGSEVPVYSERLRVAGTIDLLGNWRNRDVLIDFKSTASVPETVGPQTAGYMFLYREVYGTSKRKVHRYCVHLTPSQTTPYRVIPLEDSRDESIFLSSLNLYHWGRQHGYAAVAA